MTEAELILFESAAEWEQWLDENADQSSGVWLKIAKKSSGKESLNISQALDGALCFGWIDSQRLKYDDDFYLQRYSPRRKKNNWSQINIASAERLMQAGKMREAGIREIKMAKADGRYQI